MRRDIGRIGIITSLALATIMSMIVPVSAMHEPTLVSAASGSRTLPRTDGTTVVWIDYRESDDLSNPDIYGVNLSERHEFPIAIGPATQTMADIDNGIVVWEASSPECLTCAMDIRGKNLSSGQEFEVAATAADETRPAISGNWVIWLNSDESGLSLKGRDIGTMAEAITITERQIRKGPVFDGDRILWEEATSDTGYGWRLLTLRLGEQEPVVIAEGRSNSRGGSYGFGMAGDLVVYVDGPTKIVTADLATGETTEIPGAPYDQAPTTDGRYVFWDRSINGSDGQRHDLMGYDLTTHSLFTVEANTGYNTAPNVANGVLTWQRNSEEIHAAPIADLLPSARLADPGMTNPDWTYFPQTGHYLSAGFREFWETQGGLAVFGYPLTEEFAMLNQESGDFQPVQYLERQRYEYHAEHAGTVYEVLLGRLGANLAGAYGLLASDAFAPLTLDTGSDEHCTFFSESGHRLCHGFRAYWQAHGLEFGDDGVSYRESVALFGYPISEEYIDPATGLTVQYFERARFEYHPNNPDPYKILLGRLGAESLALTDD